MTTLVEREKFFAWFPIYCVGSKKWVFRDHYYRVKTVIENDDHYYPTSSVMYMRYTKEDFLQRVLKGLEDEQQ